MLTGSATRGVFGTQSNPLRRKVVGILVFLVAANLAVWAWAFLAFHSYPLMLITALVAYTFGLRHAVDADHIAAIDNVTRKLMQQGQRPVGVGFFFSLGHSTIVIALSIAIALTSIALQDRFDTFKEIGGLIGTCVSAGFLLGLALLNGLILMSLWRTYCAVRRGEPYQEGDLDYYLSQRGFFGRIFRPLFGLVNHSWQMYGIGLLFGLGFDTATEVGVFGITAVGASKGLSIWAILVFPALFTAGMALIDTLESLLMLGAYGWAFVNPVRKLYYNLTVTFISVVVAALIGGIEVLGLIGGRYKFQGAFWDTVGGINDYFGVIGGALVGLFALCWLGSWLVYRLNRFAETGAQV